jgi:formamidopyrimidine-DNA glycosylase
MRNDMPELPDIIVYIEDLERRILNQRLLHARIAHPFILRTAEPPVSAAENKRVLELRLIGKRIATALRTSCGSSFN